MQCMQWGPKLGLGRVHINSGAANLVGTWLLEEGNTDANGTFYAYIHYKNVVPPLGLAREILPLL